MNELDKLIQQLIKEKGGSRKDYLSLIKKIEHHETGGTYDTQIEAGKVKGHAKESGAVGILQYKKGKNEGGITAARRLDRYYKKIESLFPLFYTTYYFSILFCQNCTIQLSVCSLQCRLVNLPLTCIYALQSSANLPNFGCICAIL